jgi:hypothetical protein
MNAPLSAWSEKTDPIAGELLSPISPDSKSWGRLDLKTCVVLICLGAGCYGAAMGWWRSPKQALYNGIKFPLVIFGTQLLNALINLMLAPLLGFHATLRETLRLLLLSFGTASLILLGLAPLILFIVWNVPAMGGPGSWLGYSVLQWFSVCGIAFAGIAANVRLARLVSALSGSRRVARNVVIGWLAVNLLVGSELSWIGRPFFGSPGLEVQFIRDDAFRGNFFDSLYSSAGRIF